MKKLSLVLALSGFVLAACGKDTSHLQPIYEPAPVAPVYDPAPGYYAPLK